MGSEKIKQSQGRKELPEYADRSTITAAARKIFEDRETGQQFQNLGHESGITNFKDAYSVQNELVQMLSKKNNTKPAGHKVALASAAAQSKCGISEPIAGVVLENSVLQSGSTIVLSDHQHLGIEFEIGFRIKEDFIGKNSTFIKDDILKVVDCVFPAIDLLDDRYLDYGELHAISLIADNTCSAGAVVGNRSPFSSFFDVAATVIRDDKQFRFSPIRETIGDPFDLLEWISNGLNKRDEFLSAGDIVLSGALFPPAFPEPGETYQFSLTGYGSVSVSFQ